MMDIPKKDLGDKLLFPSYQNIDSYDHGSLLHKKGYVILDNFITPEASKLIINEISLLFSSYNEAKSLIFLVQDNNGRVIVGNRLEKQSDFLFDMARHPQLLSLGEVLLGKPVVPLAVEFFDKPPGSILCAPPHQDHIFYNHFPDEMALALWIALDPVHENNGALEFSNEQFDSLLPHETSSTIHFDKEVFNWTNFSFKKVLVSSGSCIAFHSFALHRSGPNLTLSPRRAVVFNYRGSPYRATLRKQKLN